MDLMNQVRRKKKIHVSKYRFQFFLQSRWKKQEPRLDKVNPNILYLECGLL